MVRKLIGKAALAAAMAGALATVAAASPPPGRTPTPPPVPQVSVQDVRVPVPGQQPVPAYLVRSAGTLKPGSQAGYCSCTGSGRFTATGPNSSPRPSSWPPGAPCPCFHRAFSPGERRPAGSRAM